MPSIRDEEDDIRELADWEEAHEDRIARETERVQKELVKKDHLRTCIGCGLTKNNKDRKLKHEGWLPVLEEDWLCYKCRGKNIPGLDTPAVTKVTYYAGDNKRKIKAG